MDVSTINPVWMKSGDKFTGVITLAASSMIVIGIKEYGLSLEVVNVNSTRTDLAQSNPDAFDPFGRNRTLMERQPAIRIIFGKEDLGPISEESQQTIILGGICSLLSSDIQFDASFFDAASIVARSFSISLSDYMGQMWPVSEYLDRRNLLDGSEVEEDENDYEPEHYVVTCENRVATLMPVLKAHEPAILAIAAILKKNHVLLGEKAHRLIEATL